MELLTTTEKGAMIFSDYGHVAESLEIGRKALEEKFPEKELICVFQPHQMHRILQGRDRFPEAMKGYHQRFIYRIYAARETFEEITDKRLKTTGVHNVDELGVVFAQHCDALYLNTFTAVADIIEQARENEIIVVYAAGDIDYDLRKFLRLLPES
jgi:UDP-N-acetylmuramate--alanine ligase